MSNSCQIYRSLKSNEFRILILQPGTKSDLIRCHLKHVSLSHKPTYEACSYMWGADDVSQSIEIDEQNVYVRENLWQALLHLRRTDVTRAIWIDALCINQDDNRERNHQVSQMGMIYKQAENVCVWLGEPVDPSEPRETFEFITSASAQKEVQSGKLRSSRSWGQVEKLCYLPYWQRLWIVQEVVLAARIHLYWGNSVLSWDVLATTVLRAFEHPRWTLIPLAQFISQSIPQKLYRQRREVSLRNKAPIFSLVQTYELAQCGEKRDRVFALLSLADKCCKRAVPVDYSKPQYLICIDIWTHHVQYHRYRSYDIIENIKNVRRIVEEGEEEIGRMPGPKYNDAEPVTLHGHDWLSKEWVIHRILSSKWLRKKLLKNRWLKSRLGHTTTVGVNMLNFVECVTPTLNDLDPHSLRIEQSNHILKQHARYALSFVGAIPKDDENRDQRRTFHSTNAASRKDGKTESRTTSIERNDNIRGRKGSDLTLRYSLTRLVLEIIRCLAEDPNYEDCVLFLSNQGGVGLAPSATRVGDVILQTFDREETVAIVRKVDKRYMVLGQTVYLTSTTNTSGTGIDCEIDIPSMQVLTKPIPRRDDFSWYNYISRSESRSDFKALLRMIEANLRAESGAGNDLQVL